MTPIGMDGTNGVDSKMSRVVGVGHLGATVSNLDSTRRFFVEVLNFTAQDEVVLDSDFSSSITGIPNASITAGFVISPDGVVIELLEYHAPSDRGSSTARTCDTGSMHLALYVEDIEPILDRALPLGWSLLGDITAITTGPRAGGRAAYIRDSNSIVLELVQRPQGATHKFVVNGTR